LKGLFENKLFKFLSSVKLALPMILILAVFLASGTIVESLYSTPVAKRFVYGTWWFGGFLFLLGLNVFCSALSRLPWKKHHTGFVITHLGILCVLAGSLITRQSGTDGQIALAEGAQGSIFQEDKPMLSCRIGSGEVRSIPAGFMLLEPRPSIPFTYNIPPSGVLKVDRFYLNAQKVVGARAAGGKEPGAVEAVHLKLQSSFIQQDNWLFLGKEGFDQVDLGPASVYFSAESVWKSRLKKEGNDFPVNTLVLLKSGPGRFQFQVRHRGVWAPVKPLKVGVLESTGWMDMRFQIVEAMPQALPDITYVPSPLAYQKDPRPAVHFEAEDGANRAEGWLGFEDQITFPLGGKTWSLTYGPRQASLPFVVALHQFHLGLDPGTQNPASYASDIATFHPGKDAPAPYTISMNHPLHEQGYTLYQASYFPQGDGKYTSVFSVGRDPGLPLKYGGALTMVLGIIFMFWFKNPAWKKKDVK
jgi:hypothetical protein